MSIPELYAHGIFCLDDQDGRFNIGETVLRYETKHHSLTQVISVPGEIQTGNHLYPFSVLSCVHRTYLDLNGQEIKGTKVKRVLFCTGKVYYDLLTHRKEHNIKDVAIEFVNHLLYPYDRVSVVTFDRLAHNITKTEPTHDEGWQNNILNIEQTINGLTVYQPGICNAPDPAIGNCLNYYTNADGDPDLSIGCMYPANNGGDRTSCTSSNIGGGLQQANYQFTQKERLEALWIVILLAGGPANATSPTADNPYGYCSPSYWSSPSCRDDQANVRHPNTSTDYDGDDFARDIADQLVGENAQGAVVYSIGLGEKVQNDTRHRNADYDPDIAEQLLEYIATEAGTPNQGIYYYAADASGLTEIFKKIAENIATKISQ